MWIRARPCCPGVIVLPLLEKNPGQHQQREGRIAVEKDAMLTGEDVADARPAFDNMNQSYVTLTFNARGGRIFERVTGESVGRRMAIVLDGKVYSAPVIRERIGGGRASISGSFTTAEAQDLAIVLRAGSCQRLSLCWKSAPWGPLWGRKPLTAACARPWWARPPWCCSSASITA